MGRDILGFDGEPVLVTGGARGIGAGICALLAEAGATVIVADIDGPAAETQAEALRAAGHRAGHVQVDLASEASIVAACRSVAEAHGPLWGLVNNAALLDRQMLLDGTADEWDRISAVNARGVFLIIREVARTLVAAGRGGRIVTIASTANIGAITQGHAIYAASKAALAGLTRAAALELAAHAITVNMVLPGAVATPGAMASRGPAPEGPARRAPPLGMCEPRDIGAAVALLVSPLARSITNQAIAVDGGWSIS